jgi:hypothetical protein
MRLIALAVLAAGLLGSIVPDAAPARAAAVVDPRLNAAYTLLAVLQDRDGTLYIDVLDASGTTIVVGALPRGRLAVYYLPSRRIIVSTAALGEDATVLASIIAHELQHVADRDRMRLGRVQLDCVEREVRAFDAQARVWRTFWPDTLLDGTQVERDIAEVTLTQEASGLDGIRGLLMSSPGYQSQCAS